jgi:hypothetical protein
VRPSCTRVSTTLSALQWGDTTVLSGDVAAAIGEPRTAPGGQPQVWGSGTSRTLCDATLPWEVAVLVDEHVVRAGACLLLRQPGVVSFGEVLEGSSPRSETEAAK